jgi:hypothetical protein
MSYLKEALRMQPKTVKVGDLELTLRRPSLVDFAVACEKAKENEAMFSYWLVYNHLLDAGKPVFKTPEEVLECDVKLITDIAAEIDKLYGEGRD